MATELVQDICEYHPLAPKLLLLPITLAIIPFSLPLSKLPPHDPQRKKIRMRIGKEACRILLNPPHRKSTPSILSIRTIQSTGKRTRKAANTDSLAIITNWIGERETWGSRGTASRFVDVCCGPGGRLVGACYVEERDVL
jgi:hypothetical protein